MKTIILNFAGVSPANHASFLNQAIALGYIVVEGEVLDTEEQSSTQIPLLYPFEVPQGSTIASAKEDLRLDHSWCKENLIDENFPYVLPKGDVIGGFISMNKTFESQEAINVINKLAEQTNRKFRPGTALELMLFFKKNRSVCPKYFIALGTIWNGEVLVWYDDFSEFNLGGWGGRWDHYHQIFLVEDL